MSSENGRNINLNIAGDRRISLTIPRDPVTERRFRKGAEEVNRLFARYEQSYPKATREEILTYVSLHLARNLAAFHEEMEALNLAQELQSLIAEIDDAAAAVPQKDEQHQ